MSWVDSHRASSSEEEECRAEIRSGSAAEEKTGSRRLSVSAALYGPLVEVWRITSDVEFDGCCVPSVQWCCHGVIILY